MHAFAHVTGGGIPGNLARVLPDRLRRRRATAARGTSRGSSPRSRPPATCADDEMEHVFNLGLGMLAVVAPESRFDTLDAVRSAGHEAWVVGEVSMVADG